MHVCENVSSLGMGEHGDRGVPSMLGVGDSEFLASGVGERWDRVASTLGDGGDTLLKLGDSMGIFSILSEGSGNSIFISISAKSPWERIASLDTIGDNGVGWFGTPLR